MKLFPCIETALPCSINQIQQSKKTVEIPSRAAANAQLVKQFVCLQTFRNYTGETKNQTQNETER